MRRIKDAYAARKNQRVLAKLDHDVEVIRRLDKIPGEREGTYALEALRSKLDKLYRVFASYANRDGIGSGAVREQLKAVRAAIMKMPAEDPFSRAIKVAMKKNSIKYIEKKFTPEFSDSLVEARYKKMQRHQATSKKMTGSTASPEPASQAMLLEALEEIALRHPFSDPEDKKLFESMLKLLKNGEAIQDKGVLAVLSGSDNISTLLMRKMLSNGLSQSALYRLLDRKENTGYFNQFYVKQLAVSGQVRDDSELRMLGALKKFLNTVAFKGTTAAEIKKALNEGGVTLHDIQKMVRDQAKNRSVRSHLTRTIFTNDFYRLLANADKQKPDAFIKNLAAMQEMRRTNAVMSFADSISSAPVRHHTEREVRTDHQDKQVEEEERQSPRPRG